MKSKQIRGLDDETWRKVKIISAVTELSLADVMRLLVEIYESANGEIK